MDYDGGWTNYETAECYAELFVDGENYERMEELISKTFSFGGGDREQIGYLAAWIEAYCKSEFFDTVMLDNEIDQVNFLEIAEDVLDGLEDVVMDGLFE